MPNISLIEKKLDLIVGYLSELFPIISLDNATIKNNKEKLRAVERLLQIIVDTAVDINTHIIAEENFESPDTYRGTFIVLGDKNVLPKEFSNKISDSVGLRNAVMHQYEKVDVDRMLNDIRNNIDDYKEYVRMK